MRKTGTISRLLLVLAAAAFAFAQGACQRESITVTTYHFERCGEMEFVCFCEDSAGERSPAPMDMCQSSEDESDCSPYAFVLQTNRDEIGVVDIGGGVLVDSDVRVPFNTFAQTGRSPSDIAASADGRKIYVTHAGDDFVALFEASGFLGEFLPGYIEIPLPGPSSSIAVSASEPRAYVTLPENSAIAVLNLEDPSLLPAIYYFSSIPATAEEEEVEEAAETAEETGEEPEDAASDADAPSDAAQEQEEEDAGAEDAAEDPAPDDAAGDIPDAQEMASFVPWVALLRETETERILAVSGSGEEGGVMIFDASRIGDGLESAFVSRVLQGVPVRNFAFTPAGEPVGDFLYAVDRDAGTVHVVKCMEDDTTCMEVDTTGGNPLVEAGAIKLDGQAQDVTILELDFGDQVDPQTLTGVFGFIVTSKGDLYVTDIRDGHRTGDYPFHVLRNANDDADSIPIWASQPSVFVNEAQIQYVDLASLQRSVGYPVPDPTKATFSPSGPAGTTYYMYGVSFFPYDPWVNDPAAGPFPDIRRAVTQQWRISYEDTLPYSGGIGGNIGEGEEGGIMTDAGLPFCAVGVRDLDVLVIDDPPNPIEAAADCSRYKAEGGMEYRITEAYQTELRLETIPNRDGKTYPLPDEECFPFAVRYHVRASGQWVVTGTATGYLHDWGVDDSGRCIDNKPPCSSWGEEDCTLLSGRAVEERPFVNPYIKFIMRSGTIPAGSTMTYLYGAMSGFQPLSLTVARLAHSVRYLPWNKYLYVTDAATEGLVEIDLENFLVSYKYF